MTIKKCLKCKKKFNTYFSTQKYCSKECFESMPKLWLVGNTHGFIKGQKAWNKGKKWTQDVKNKISRNRKGKGLNNQAAKGNHNGMVFKKLDDRVLGISNCNWKGNKVSYRNLHRWVHYWLGKPKQCEMCQKTNGRLHWANKSGNYLR